MMRLFGILTLAGAVAGCVAVQPNGYGDPYYGYGPGYYTPSTAIGVGVGGSSFGRGSVGGGVGLGVGF
jgi:hypothetical protein